MINVIGNASSARSHTLKINACCVPVTMNRASAPRAPISNTTRTASSSSSCVNGDTRCHKEGVTNFGSKTSAAGAFVISAASPSVPDPLPFMRVANHV